MKKKFYTVDMKEVWLSVEGFYNGYRVGDRFYRNFNGPGIIAGFDFQEGAVYISFDKDNERVRKIKERWQMEKIEEIA